MSTGLAPAAESSTSSPPPQPRDTVQGLQISSFKAAELEQTAHIIPTVFDSSAIRSCSCRDFDHDDDDHTTHTSGVRFNVSATDISNTDCLTCTSTSTSPSAILRTPSHPPTGFRASTGAASNLRINTALPSLTASSPRHLHPAMAHTPDNDDVTSRSRNVPGAPQTGSPMSSYFSARSLEQRTPMSPASASLLPSPALSAMIDITPLPSPQFMDELSSPRRHPSLRHRKPRTASHSTQYAPLDSLPSRSNSVISPKSPSRKQKTYTSLISAAVQQAHHYQHADDSDSGSVKSGKDQPSSHGHARARSVSDFVPEALCNVKQRVATFASVAFDTSDTPVSAQSAQPSLQREEHLSVRRGMATKLDVTATLPSPPDSSTSVTGSDGGRDVDAEVDLLGQGECFVFDGLDHKQCKRKWRAVKQLGQGTFSKVMLATDERHQDRADAGNGSELNPDRLVAIKIIEHGPAGGADEDRIKHSLSREVDMLKTMRHPSLVSLIALQEQSSPARTLLLLPYCCGGDLFEFASERREYLTPSLVQRIFAELVSAVSYLHTNWIVHRDIKLENVLVNCPAGDLDPTILVHPQSHPGPLFVLTDLGLSRRIATPPVSPLLTTRCGSEDYAAPELLLGQPYDGRSTDAWALGVLLYALMEGRLPFDAPPRRPEKSRNTHRIARCDWMWCKFGDDAGEWAGPSTQGLPHVPKSSSSLAADAAAAAVAPMHASIAMNGNSPSMDVVSPVQTASSVDFASWEGARVCVEGLLRKARMGRKGLDELVQTDWVRMGIQVPGGLVRSDAHRDM